MTAVKVKICGLTRARDAKLAIELGAWALGFIFVESSPRRVDLPTVRAITESLRAPARKIGVFSHPSLGQLKLARDVAGLNGVQLHGDETPDFCARVKIAFPDLLVIKAFTVTGDFDSAKIEAYKACDAWLVDSPGARDGKAPRALVDFSLARSIAASTHLVLAGGLRPTNVAEAIRIVRPTGVDVCSGVESRPGEKDEDAMRAFFQAVAEVAS